MEDNTPLLLKLAIAGLSLLLAAAFSGLAAALWRFALWGAC